MLFIHVLLLFFVDAFNVKSLRLLLFVLPFHHYSDSHFNPSVLE